MPQVIRESVVVNSVDWLLQRRDRARLVGDQMHADLLLLEAWSEYGRQSVPGA